MYKIFTVPIRFQGQFGLSLKALEIQLGGVVTERITKKRRGGCPCMLT